MYSTAKFATVVKRELNFRFCLSLRSTNDKQMRVLHRNSEQKSNFCRLFSAFYRLGTYFYIFSTSKQPCDYVRSHFACQLHRIVNLGNYSVLIAIVFCALERTVATVMYKKYEKIGKVHLSVALVALQWTATIAWTVMAVWRKSKVYGQ